LLICFNNFYLIDFQLYNKFIMLSFPNAKINIGLHVISKRPDGFHNIESVFCPIDYKDILEIVPETIKNNPSSFNFTGIHIDSAEENNLCFKAYHLLKKDYIY
jgi:4-diphosphocytidyl-2-C-methyl-D-erythritol kinase